MVDEQTGLEVPPEIAADVAAVEHAASQRMKHLSAMPADAPERACFCPRCGRIKRVEEPLCPSCHEATLSPDPIKSAREAWDRVRDRPARVCIKCGSALDNIPMSSGWGVDPGPLPGHPDKFRHPSGPEPPAPDLPRCPHAFSDGQRCLLQPGHKGDHEPLWNNTAPSPIPYEDLERRIKLLRENGVRTYRDPYMQVLIDTYRRQPGPTPVLETEST